MHKTFIYPIYLTFFAIILGGCNSPRNQQNAETENATQPEVVNTKDSLVKGKLLYATYCKGCHILPDPQRLPKEVWGKGILPIMAIRMGIKNPDLGRLISPEEKKIEDENNLIPNEPLVNTSDFELIKQYIFSVAPDSLPYAKERLNRNKALTQFSRKNITLDSSSPSLITGIRFNSTTKTLWISNMNNRVLKWKWNKGIIGSQNVSSSVVDFTFLKNKTYLTQIGSLMPTELSTGSLTEFGNNNKPILEKLHRPVCAVAEDLNNDGIPEIVVGNFGKNLGSLSLYKKSTNNLEYKEEPLLSVPGTVKCFFRDMNNDGRKDMIALFSQADESVYIFFQQDNLKFKAHRILRFPPDNGTTDMVFTDYNKDGLIDIVTANGDNADYSNVLKTYHGIRVHINKGDNVFKEAFFYPVYGATKVLAEDFDQDGDVDFAINCFYSDFGALLSESFVYLENKDTKNYKFTSFTRSSDLPAKSLTLEKADIDGDGDIDIIMGNFAASPVKLPAQLDRQWKQARYGLIILENKLR